MRDQDKTKAQLVSELEELRGRVAALTAQVAQSQQSEADQEQISNSLPVLVATAGFDGYYKKVNTFFEKILGWTEQESLSRPFIEFIHTDDHAAAVETFRQLASGKTVTGFVDRNICRDGSHRWINWTVIPLMDRSIIFGIGEDITEKKLAEEERQRAEAALRESEERYRSFVQDFPGIAYRGHLDFTPIFFHGAVEAITGYSEEEFTSGRLHWDQVIHPDDLVQIQESVEKVRSVLAYSTAREYRIVRKDGQVRWVHEIIHNTCDGSDKPTFVQGVLYDVTAQKQAEEALRESENRYRTLAESSPDIVYILDESGTLRYANRAAAAYMGLSSVSLVGKTQRDLFPPDKAQNHRERIRRVFETGKAGEMEECCRLGSQDVWLNVRSIPLRDEQGRVTSVMGVCRNITERKQAEETLRESHRTLRTLIDASPESIFLLDANGTLLLANVTTARRLDKTMDEVAGRTLSDILPADLAVERMRRISEVFSTGKAIAFEDHRVGRHFLNAVHPIFDDQGKVAKVAVLGIDQTDRKLAAEALQKAHDELEEKVNERTAELSAANEQLRIFRQFAETSGQGFSMADLGGHLVYMNPALCRMLGEDKPQDRIGQHLSIYYPDEANRTRETERFPALMRDGYWQGELPMLSCRGRLIPTWHNTFLLRDESGKPFRIAVVITDITERKQAEEALRFSEEKYRLLVETTDTGYVILDGQGSVIDANAEYLRISGQRTLEEIVGRTVVEWTAPYDVERNAKDIEKLYRIGSTRHLEIDYVHPDGKIIPIDINASCLDTEDGRRIVSLCRDITERKQAQASLQQSHDELQAIYDGIVEGIFIADAELSKVIRANGAYCRMVGWSGEELYTLSPERVHPPEVLPRVWEHLEAVKKGNLARIDHLPFLRKDGSIVYADVVTSPIVYNGRPGWISLFHDVTERKKAQKALERERQSLWRMLQASDHERQIISYEIHDGLAQYLAGAGMQFQAYEALRKTSPREARKAYKTAVELVRQSQLEARRLISEVRPPVIDEIGLETAISHLVHEQRQHGGPKIEFRSEVQFGRLPQVLENALYRIAQEALTNACKHSKSKKVTVTMSQEGQEIHLEVRDWGIGFDPESVEKGHFGLEGIRQRVRLLGGRLTIESKPGSGTIVQVVMSIVERQNEE